jgi:hypothetical protein
VVALQQPFQRLAEVFQQMPAVSNLHGIGRPLARTVCVRTGTIAADGRHIGLIAEPRGQRCGIAPKQEIKRAMLLHVHEDRPIGPPSAPAPIIHTEDMWRTGIRQCRRHHGAQECHTADRDAECGE